MFRLMLPLLVWLVLMASPVPAAVFWDDDFESASGTTIPNWVYDFGPDPNMQESTEQARTGTHGIKAVYIPSAQNPNGNAASIGRVFTPSTDIFVRFAYRQSTGFLTGSTGQSKVLRIATEQSNWNQVLHIEAISSTPGSGPPGAWGLLFINAYACNTIDTWFYANAGPRSTSWQDVEIQLHLNTPGLTDGALRMWLDGTLALNVQGLAMVGPTPTSIGCFGAPAPSTSTFGYLQLITQSGVGNGYYDRVAVGNTQIGVVSGGPPAPDTTPPGQPTGLAVN